MARWWLTATCLAVLAGGCGVDAADEFRPEPEGPVNSCEGDRDCAPGTRCDPDARMCVTGQEPQFDVALRIVPPADMPRVTASQLQVEQAAQPGPLDLRAALERLEGVVRDPQGEAIGAQLEFTPVFEAAEAWLPRSSLSVMTRRGVGEQEEFGFSVDLSEGRAYEVQIQPLEGASRLPPLRTRYPLEGEADGEGATVEFAYPELRSVRGELVSATGEPEVQRNVRLVEPETGRSLSSLATTDLQGSFTLFVPASVESLKGTELEVRSGPPAELSDAGDLLPEPENLLMVLRYDAAMLGLQLDADVAAPVHLPVLPPTVEVKFLVEKKLPDEAMDPDPVENVDVTFFTEIDLGEGVRGLVSRTAVSNPEGVTLELPGLLPGTELDAGPQFDYSVLLRPPPLARANVRTTLLRGVTVQAMSTEGGTQRGEALFLRLSVPYDGTVIDQQCQRQPGALVRARPLKRAWALQACFPEAAYNRTLEVPALAEDGAAVGNYGLGLDVGYYDLTAQPPEGSGFPWAVHPNVQVPSSVPRGQCSAEPLSAQQGVDLVLQSPVILQGQVRLGSERAPAGTVVEAYRQYADFGERRAIQIGRATVDAQGDYRLLLPPRFNTEVAGVLNQQRCTN